MEDFVTTITFLSVSPIPYHLSYTTSIKKNHLTLGENLLYYQQLPLPDGNSFLQ